MDQSVAITHAPSVYPSFLSPSIKIITIYLLYKGANSPGSALVTDGLDLRLMSLTVFISVALILYLIFSLYSYYHNAYIPLMRLGL